MDNYLLNVGTNNVGGYFSSEQIDLLKIIQCNNLDDLIRFIDDCDQIKHLFNEQEITSLNELDVENAKRKVFVTYQNTMVLHNAIPVIDIENKLRNIGVRDEHIPYITQYLGNRDLQGIRRTIESLYPDKAKDILTLSHRFTSQERDQIKSSKMYDEFVILNNNLPSFNTMLVGSGKIYSVVNSFYESNEPEYRFDFYKAKRDFDFALANGKQVRFHSLLVKEDAHLFDGKSKEEILNIMSDYVRHTIDFVNEYNNNHKVNGQPVINAIDLFNEIVSFDVNEQGQYYNIWEAKYGITMQELMPIFDYAKEHKPEGVSYLYNEPFLENDDRRRKVFEILQQISTISPGLIDTLGSQMHITITEDLNKIKRCYDDFKQLQEMTGMKIQITEFDMSLGSREIGHVFGANADYTLSQVYDIKRKQMEQISQIIINSGVNLSGISYWSLTDGIDCNLERIRTNLLDKGAIKDINQIPTACGGLIPTHKSMIKQMQQNDNSIDVDKKINELVEEIKNQQFGGTDEEIKMQQIMYFDKYVKDNIDYGFEALTYQEELKKQGIKGIDTNPYKSAFVDEGFFKENKNGQRLAVCGSISSVANKVLNKLGIQSEYVWGHINSGTKENPHYVGHRWNIVTLGDKQYMVDFTMGMVIHNKDKNDTYSQASRELVDKNDLENEYSYLFTDKIGLRQSIDGFEIRPDGTVNHNKDDMSNAITDPYKKYPNLGNKQVSELTPIMKNEGFRQEQSNPVETQPVQTQISTPIQETKKGFDQRSQSEVQIANQIKQKNMAIKQQKEQQRSLEKPKVKTLTKQINGGSPSSGFVDTLILTLITGFVAGAIFMIVYNILK